MQNYREIVSNEKQFKPRLFVYPVASDSQAVFDLDDLAEEALILLCIRANPDEGIDDDTLHIWRGPDFEVGEVNPGKFISDVISAYWGPDIDQEKIDKVE